MSSDLDSPCPQHQEQQWAGLSLDVQSSSLWFRKIWLTSVELIRALSVQDSQSRSSSPTPQTISVWNLIRGSCWNKKGFSSSCPYKQQNTRIQNLFLFQPWAMDRWLNRMARMETKPWQIVVPMHSADWKHFIYFNIIYNLGSSLFPMLILTDSVLLSDHFSVHCYLYCKRQLLVVKLFNLNID